MNSTCLAREFTAWLKTVLLQNTCDVDQSVCVVSVLGQSAHSGTELKSSVLNQAIERTAFVAAWHSPYTQCTVEAYYDSGHRTVFLHFLTADDNQVAVHLLNNVPADQNVESVLEQWRNQRNVHWLLAMLLSHIVLVVLPCTRLNPTIARTLRQLNYIRDNSLEQVSSVLSGLPGVSHEWCRYGRMCSPRILFAMQRCPIRADLGAVKRKELINKLSRSIENQIYGLFRKSRVVTNNCHQSVCAIPANEPFVHVWDSACERAQPVLHVLYTTCLMSMSSMSNQDQSSTALNTEHSFADEHSGVSSSSRTRPTVDREFSSFLLGHINAAHSDGFNDNTGKNMSRAYFELPKLKCFVSVAGALHDLLIVKGEQLEQCIAHYDTMLCPHKHYMQTRAKRVLAPALRVYETDLPAYYPELTHSVKLAQAEQYVAMHIRGHHYAQTVDNLRAQCVAIWTGGRQACTALSLTAQNCAHPVHRTPDQSGTQHLADTEDTPKQTMSHQSAARYLSTCNCGRKQALREDPFTLKAANFDFYANEDFKCCANLERYEFPVFKPSVTALALSDTNNELVSESRAADSHTVTVDLDTEQDTELLMLDLDRDNRLHHTPALPIDSAHTDALSLYERSSVTAEHDSALSQPVVSCEQEQDTEHVHVTETSTGPNTAHLEGEEGDTGSDSDNSSYDHDEAVEKCHDQAGNARRRPRRSLQVSESSGDEEGPSQEHSTSASDNDNEHNQQVASLTQDIEELLRLDDTLKAKQHTLHESKAPSDTDTDSVLAAYKGQYLEHLPCTQATPGLHPAFPSWALVCIGHSSIYSHSHGSVQDEAPVDSDMPVWTACSCRMHPPVNAQLQRIHVVTPKAPVAVTLNPRIQPNTALLLRLCENVYSDILYCTQLITATYYHAGTRGLLQLSFARYYVLRLPYAYASPNGPVHPHKDTHVRAGRVVRGCLGVVEADYANLCTHDQSTGVHEHADHSDHMLHQPNGLEGEHEQADHSDHMLHQPNGLEGEHEQADHSDHMLHQHDDVPLLQPMQIENVEYDHQSTLPPQLHLSVPQSSASVPTTVLKKVTIKIGEHLVRLKIVPKHKDIKTDSSQHRANDHHDETGGGASGSEPQDWVCALCGLHSHTQAQLNEHSVLVHNRALLKPYVCRFCTKDFMHKQTMLVHERVHTGEKPFQCPICTKCFSRQNNFNIHMRLHASGKRYFCQYCGKWYRSEQQMLEHELNCVQIQSGTSMDPTRPFRYTCDYCEKLFHHRRDKAIHERVHTGERPYTCGYCGRAFTQSQALTIHIRTHTGEKPYMCTLCDKTFRDSSALRKHEFNIHASMAVWDPSAHAATAQTNMDMQPDLSTYNFFH